MGIGGYGQMAVVMLFSLARSGGHDQGQWPDGPLAEHVQEPRFATTLGAAHVDAESTLWCQGRKSFNVSAV